MDSLKDDARLRTPSPLPSGCVSLKSAQSNEPIVDLKKQRSRTLCPLPSGCMSVRSAQSNEPIVDLKEERSKAYGVPKAWGGHLPYSEIPHRLKPQGPAPVVYPVQTTGHRALDGQSWNKVKPSYPSFPACESVVSDDSEDTITNFLRSETGVQFEAQTAYSSTTGSRDSVFDEETTDSEDEEVICDICCKARAMKTCLTCDISLCTNDAWDHYKNEALEEHTLTDVCQDGERKRCLQHKKPLDLFCRSDQTPICSRCARKNHKGHDIVWKRRHASQSSGLTETVVPPPGEITFLSVKPNSVILSWECPKGPEGPASFRVMWGSSIKMTGCLVIRGFHKIEINKLQLGQKYFFRVATEDKDGNLSECVEASVVTAVPAPRHLKKGHSEATALSLKWTEGEKMEGIPHQYLITITSPGKDSLAVHTEDCYKMFSDLEPDTEYIISVSTVLGDACSEPVSTTIHTEPCLMEALSKMGLDQYDDKLTLSTVMKIKQDDMSENKLETAESLPGAFLKKLTMLNANARSVRCASHDVNTDKSNAINPLDLIVALLLCSDSFLQQYIVLKMALCQFAVPLLLPNYETKQITLMLWSMREIVRTFSPSNLAFRKLSCVERIVLSDIPLVSFVRLDRMMLSKSQMLNKLLSNSQQCHDPFYHRNMVCGDVPRRISEGLVEISWYHPCGDRKVDRFTEPLAVANLRGDIRAFDKQFSFLCRTSAAIYIFCDESEADFFKNLTGKDAKANVILISSAQGKTFTLQTLTLKPSLKKTNVSQKKKTETELIKALQESVSKLLENCPNKVSIANLADSAPGWEILVDEDSGECQGAKKHVSKITERIANTSEFKDKHLASQGHIWKAISWLETECWRLRKAGNQDTEEYRKSLKTKEKALRRKQLKFEMTPVMSSFLRGVVISEVQRYYFLKWLEMDLDNLSWNQLSALQDQYKELSQKLPQHTEDIAAIDKQISARSLRLEHFLRECGQLYECASYLPDYSAQRKTMEQLPALCAQMLQDGFPLELVDGDAANIPLKWITEVLTELHYIMQSNSKLKVIAIIGAENSGKSTLLNTMFGVRFAVSKGTCTRGASIQLISIDKEVKEELGCVCIVLIDTEGLKPHQMLHDDHSHERAKEVASLAVALSDATIVSVSRDNSSEQDILEMVLYAFTRLKDVRSKPLGHFVHTDMNEKPVAKRRNSKDWWEKLNEIIRKDSRMKKAKITRISDVVKFDRDTCSWQIPSVWHGTPPMAPISVDYSETAHALKKRLLGDLKKCKARGDLMHFIERMESLWKAL
ncbi:up-regulator of cell proliferation-like [Sparus aurata]|uniref:up-regulator of cell proliferation-like n=1 Tax=Sparus aurata TaxID=8175 RepID=UPI0011C1019D|nr:up-regulator of cell proliferation-like [Sparus aurata]